MIKYSEQVGNYNLSDFFPNKKVFFDGRFSDEVNRFVTSVRNLPRGLPVDSVLARSFGNKNSLLDIVLRVNKVFGRALLVVRNGKYYYVEGVDGSS